MVGGGTGAPTSVEAVARVLDALTGVISVLARTGTRAGRLFGISFSFCFSGRVSGARGTPRAFTRLDCLPVARECRGLRDTGRTLRICVRVLLRKNGEKAVQ